MLCSALIAPSAGAKIWLDRKDHKPDGHYGRCQRCSMEIPGLGLLYYIQHSILCKYYLAQLGSQSNLRRYAV